MSTFPEGFEPTYEDFVTKFLQLEEEGETSLWDRGDLLVEFTEQLSLAPVTEGTKQKSLHSLASDVGRHHKTLERWRYTALIFSPEARILDLSFSHHTVAAYSQKPLYWIQEAADKEWSKHQLQEAIKAAEHPEEAWVTKTVRTTCNLHGTLIDDLEAIRLYGKDLTVELFVREGDPTRLGCALGNTIQVEVEARIRVRRSGGGD